ncbi:zinc finger protein ZFP2-like [Anopheles maculipalpis]|uniref:zinc finger protein ZFP2-like n=1 Tax=Anopheles maculipalpis TaxID=1496333 RepID=UPI0021592951|nr:zinc finger protein ZFP2-like [Anopheles maculipalpis]
MSTLDTTLAPNTLLFDSKVCRLCGESNENGRPLFRESDASGECEVSRLINQYLPVKVHNDGVLPRWICPGCHIQLESTAQFFEMIMKGQRQIELLREKQQQQTVDEKSGSARVEDIGQQLYDIMDPEWNELFAKPGMISADKESLLVPLELFELEDLLKPIESATNLGAPEAAPMTESSTGKVENETVPVTKPAEPIEAVEKVEEKDWIVKSEVTATTRGRVIGFVHHNHSKTDIGNLVLVEDAKGKKKISAQFVCDICSESFAREPRYLKHRKTHSILFECSVCLLKFGSNGKLLVHQQQTLHNGKGMVEGLQLPGDSGSKRKGEREHSGTGKNGSDDQGEPPKADNVYACDSCDNTFAGLNTVLAHEEAVHAHDNHSFVCIECGKAFREKNLLHRHRQTHVQDRTHRCTVCEAAFKTRSTLTKHARSHEDTKRYRCTLCEQQFAYKSGFDKHLDWHNGVKRFECEHCSKRFSQRGNLKEHQRVHSGDKPFQCGVCEARFGTSSQHKAHVKRHENVRPYECDMCEKSFILREHYNTHLRRHRNEKPFACGDCPRSFVERWALTKHLRTHTQEKPYSCKHCGKSFSDPSNLSRHVSSVHEKKQKDQKEVLASVASDGTLFDVPGGEGSNGIGDETLAGEGMLTLDGAIYMEQN